jgi:N-methylhydantoinase A/oxoprolinase/acetone carboxylase beta subunit
MREAELQRQQVSRGSITTHRRVHVRYQGSDSALIVPFGDAGQIEAGFEAAYRQRFAFLMQGKGLVVEAVSVEAVVAGDAPAEPRHATHEPREVPRRETVRMYSGGQWHDAALVVREDLRPGDIIAGPGHHRREERDHGGRTRLGSRAHGAGPPGAGPRVPRAVSSRPAPRSTRCCWKCSTTSS